MGCMVSGMENSGVQRDYKGCESQLSENKYTYLTQNVKAKITNQTTKATTAHFLFPVKLAYANESLKN